MPSTTASETLDRPEILYRSYSRDGQRKDCPGGAMPQSTRRLLVHLAGVVAIVGVLLSSPGEAGATGNIVTTCADSGTGSLPKVVAGAPTGATITFSVS